MSRRPTIEEIKKNYKKYLIKLKGYGLCVLAEEYDGEITVYDKQSIIAQSTAGVMTLDNSLYDYHDPTFTACAIYECCLDIEPIMFVMNDEEPLHWDWEEDQVEEMTLSEVCKALGKNIKIVKE